MGTRKEETQGKKRGKISTKGAGGRDQKEQEKREQQPFGEKRLATDGTKAKSDDGGGKKKERVTWNLKMLQFF